DHEALGRTADGFPSPESNNTREEEEKILSGSHSLINCIEKFDTVESTHWYSTNRAPIRGHTGAIIGLVAVRHDITDHKRQEQMKDESIAPLNHQLRTPLTSIAGAMDLLDAGAISRLPDPLAKLIKIARGNCQRLKHLVNDILDIETIEADRIAFNLKPLEVRALLK